MTVANLVGFMPPPRYFAPPTPWTGVQVMESPARTGPWTLIDTQPLDPLDSDPTLPMLRNVSVNATLTDGWLQLVFTDDEGNTSEPSEATRNSDSDSPLPPTPDDVRNASPLLRKSFALPSADVYADADLRNLTYQAITLVQSITWRLIDATLGDLSAEGYTSEAVLDGQAPMAVQAVTRMAERLYVTTQPAFAKQVATGRRLRGFNAGPYSESYFAPGEFARRGAQQGRPAVDQDDALDTVLWALMTEDARDYFVFRATGVSPPTGVASSFDYRRQSLGYDAGGAGGLGGGFGHGGPDGY